MIKKNKLGYILVLLLAQVFFLEINQKSVFAKTDLVVEGNVLGYELYIIKPVSNITFPVLFKVTKVVEGVEKSEYIIIFLHDLYKEYAEENFGLRKITKFKLQRQTFCDTKVKNLFHPGSILENGEIVKTSQTFTLVPGVERDSLPLKRKIPCYIDQ